MLAACWAMAPVCSAQSSRTHSDLATGILFLWLTGLGQRLHSSQNIAGVGEKATTRRRNARLAARTVRCASHRENQMKHDRLLGGIAGAMVSLALLAPASAQEVKPAAGTVGAQVPK